MNVKIVVTLALLAAGAAALAASVSLAGTSGARTLVFTTHDEPGNFALEDLGAKSAHGPGIGDLLAFTQTLTAGGKTVGAVRLAAVGVDRRRPLTQAEGTVVLANGTIEVAGLVPQAPRFTLAVVGGTGAYVGSHGTLTIATPAHTSRMTINLVG
jgi:Allene oxide cyclase barrel like domain